MMVAVAELRPKVRRKAEIELKPSQADDCSFMTHGIIPRN